MRQTSGRKHVLNGEDTAAMAERLRQAAVRDGERFLAQAEADLAACTNPQMLAWWEAQVAAARESLERHRAALACEADDYQSGAALDLQIVAAHPGRRYGVDGDGGMYLILDGETCAYRVA